ncbi:MAG: DegT/DnrJ/EryC1/StrS family aminotransferase [Planctomycetes bacterium]|nr:DegT/DnrJ/EryC1/StrS family aminotransferase [Planctomycetota bacterium]
MGESRPPIRLHRAELGPEEERAVLASLRTGELSGDGPHVGRLAERLAALCGVPHVHLLPSATAALELACAALALGPGDEVVVPAFTFPTTVSGLLARGATIVFADVDAQTLCLAPDDVARVVGPRTRALLPVDYAGVSADLSGLRAAAGRDVLVIDDAAHAVGTRFDDRPLGADADATVFSFHQTKNVTCGEGGALLLRDDDVARLAEVLADKGTNRGAFRRGEVVRYEWVASGSSGQLADPLAAIVLAQLDKLEAITDARRAVAAAYDEAFAELFDDGTLRPQRTPERCRRNGHLYVVRTRDGRARDRLLATLADDGIEAAFHFVPLHTTGFARRTIGPPRVLPVTEDAGATLVRLPIHAGLDEAALERVIAAVRRGVR